MRNLLIATLLPLVLVGCSNSSTGLTKGQASACNATKADAASVAAQVQSLSSGGDQQTAAASIATSLKDVQKQAEGQSGAIHTALAEVASDISAIEVSLSSIDMSSPQITSLITALEHVNTACHIDSSG